MPPLPEHPARERLTVELGDLTRVRADAIGNAANRELAGGGGVDGAIHAAAGPGLAEELRRNHPEGCPTGECRRTSAHGLDARWILHCVGPVWRGGDEGEPRLLAATYRAAMALADEVGARTVAFPAISAGVYGYPARESAEVALGTLADELAARPGIERVRMVLFGDELLRVYREELARLWRILLRP